MDWIKRNLMFVIGSAIALVLMGLAGFYLYTGMTKNDEAVTKLNEAYRKVFVTDNMMNEPIPVSTQAAIP